MAGSGTQIALIIPSHDLVVVRLGHYRGGGYYRPYNRYYYAPPSYYSPYAQPYYYGYGPGYYAPAPPPPAYGPRVGIGLYFNF